MNRQSKLLASILLVATSNIIWAASSPVNVAADSRVKKVQYNPEQVYEIKTSFGVSSTILFGENEEVTAVSLGDPTVWQVTPVANSINVKPVALNPNTNMTVWTNKHIYLFNLQAETPHLDESGQVVKPKHTKDLLYMLKFIYPKEDYMAIPNTIIGQTHYSPECTNRDYTAYGNPVIAPHKVCDDGRFTYFEFTQHQNHPAIFLVDANGIEHAANFRQSGQYLVIERLGAQFTIRYGDDVASVFNEYPPKELKPQVA